MTATAHLAPRGATAKRPPVAGLVLDQVLYSTRELWRTRFVLIFTFLLPLIWLVLIGILAGNDAVDQASGVRVMQFVTPTAAGLGVLFAAFPTVANGLALAREQKVTKRLRGTPLPTWVYLVGRVGAAAVLATAAVLVMIGLGVIVYGVQIQWDTVPATLATLVLSTACLAAAGLAVGALARSASVAQTAAMGIAIALAFLSGMFTVGMTIPDWMASVSSVFPVRHMLTGLQDQFNPFLSGSGWDLRGLAVIAGWGIGAIAVAAWALGREPRWSSSVTAATKARATASPLQAEEPGRPSWLGLLLDQARWANLTAMRDAGWVFFGIGMPVGLYALFASMYRDATYRPDDTDLSLFLACGMAAYGAGVTAFVAMPEAIAIARDRGILKRLRGTPLAPLAYLAGRTAAILWISAVTLALIFAIAIVFVGVRIAPERVAQGVGVALLGTLSLAACGYALAALAPNAKSLTAIGLGILLPLSFFSDVFVVGGAPDWMATVGSAFPLRHFVHALADALRPGGVVDWVNVGAMTAWLAGAGVVAIRWFRWEPRS